MQKLIPIVACVIVLVSLSSFSAFADTYQPSHYCTKPFKPMTFTDESEVEMFRFEVERYKRCINDFIDEQKEAIQHHKEAAEEAIEEWNSFVRSLNY